MFVVLLAVMSLYCIISKLILHSDMYAACCCSNSDVRFQWWAETSVFSFVSHITISGLCKFFEKSTALSRNQLKIAVDCVIKRARH